MNDPRLYIYILHTHKKFATNNIFWLSEPENVYFVEESIPNFLTERIIFSFAHVFHTGKEKVKMGVVPFEIFTHH